MWWELVMMESTIWDDYSKVTAFFYLFPVTHTKTVPAETHRATQIPARYRRHWLVRMHHVKWSSCNTRICKFPSPWYDKYILPKHPWHPAALPYLDRTVHECCRCIHVCVCPGNSMQHSCSCLPIIIIFIAFLLHNVLTNSAWAFQYISPTKRT